MSLRADPCYRCGGWVPEHKVVELAEKAKLKISLCRRCTLKAEQENHEAYNRRTGKDVS